MLQLILSVREPCQVSYNPYRAHELHRNRVGCPKDISLVFCELGRLPGAETSENALKSNTGEKDLHAENNTTTEALERKEQLQCDNVLIPEA